MRMTYGIQREEKKVVVGVLPHPDRCVCITKDQNVMPPKYTVFFKAKDADALTSAFEKFTNRKLKAKEEPSVLEQLNKLKELVAAILPDKVRHKSQERDL